MRRSVITRILTVGSYPHGEKMAVSPGKVCSDFCKKVILISEMAVDMAAQWLNSGNYGKNKQLIR